MHTALITGASRGLGQALSLALVARGVRVAGIARHAEALEAVRREAGPGFIPIVGDLANPQAPARITALAMDALGSIDLLVHNASTLGPLPMRPLLEIDAETLTRVFQINVIGPHALTRRVAGAMALRGSGTVVAISSDAATASYPDWGAYAASKAANDHLLGTLAAELPGLRFYAMDPGEMATQMHADALPDADPSTLRRPADVAASLLDRLDVAPPSGRWILEVVS